MGAWLEGNLEPFVVLFVKISGDAIAGNGLVDTRVMALWYAGVSIIYK